MDTKIKNGFSTGKGFLEKVDYSTYADRSKNMIYQDLSSAIAQNSYTVPSDKRGLFICLVRNTGDNTLYSRILPIFVSTEDNDIRAVGEYNATDQKFDCGVEYDGTTKKISCSNDEDYFVNLFFIPASTAMAN